MKKTLLCLIPLLLILLFSGCLQEETTISVKPDGSGTVSRTFMMQKEILEMLKSMGSMGDEGGDGEEFSLLDMDELQGEAQSMGPGVSLVSAVPYETDTFEGYKAVFSFSDINTLKINQNPGENVPNAASDGESVKEIVTFSFTKGSPSTLKIFLPQTFDDPDESAGDTGEPEPGELEMMKQIYGSMKMSLVVDVQGTITRTNASHREGSTLTLMELDFADIVKDEEILLRLSSSNMDSIEGLKKVMEDVPGMKVELQDTVEVQFR